MSPYIITPETVVCNFIEVVEYLFTEFPLSNDGEEWSQESETLSIDGDLLPPLHTPLLLFGDLLDHLLVPVTQHLLQPKVHILQFDQLGHPLRQSQFVARVCLLRQSVGLLLDTSHELDVVFVFVVVSELLFIQVHVLVVVVVGARIF